MTLILALVQKNSMANIAMFALGFWLSSSLLLDLVIMPGLSAAGMMSQAVPQLLAIQSSGFFNRIELLCAAVVLAVC
jgi:hypothetical protein